MISRAKDPTWGKGGDMATSCSGIARIVDALGSYEFLGLDEIIDTPLVASDPGEPKIDEAGYPNPWISVVSASSNAESATLCRYPPEPIAGPNAAKFV